MKQKICMIIACAVMIVFTIVVKIYLFWQGFDYLFQKEEQARMEAVERGDIVRGKDTVLIWKNTFDITHLSDRNDLAVKNPKAKGLSMDNVLQGVHHKRKKNKLYIISKEGYAVIDETPCCRVYVTVPAEDFVNGYTTDSEGNKHYISRFIDNEYVEYLDDFSDFSPEEQEILLEMESD
mgnify:FL=1